MFTYKFDPAHNPGILDTATWDRDSAVSYLKSVADWNAVCSAALSSDTLPSVGGITLFSPSLIRRGFADFFLAMLPDNQQIIVEIGGGGGKELFGEPLYTASVTPKLTLNAYPAASRNVDRYFADLLPGKGMRAIGCVPRIGVGTRMTTSVFPAAFDSMKRVGYAANIIQNSVRELNFMDDLVKGVPPLKNYACGFGTIETGYTGSSFEGLWLSGALSLLQHNPALDCGSDADHLQVKRGAEGLALAKRYIDSARYYSFYTLDMADILDYGALAAGETEAAEYLSKVPSDERSAYLAYHKAPAVYGGVEYRLTDGEVGRFTAKYHNALESLGVLSSYINELKEGRAYDLEFTIDEHPPEVAAFDCLTTSKEVLFVLRELARRGLPVTHVATNLGQEKGFDYRCPDGLEGLEKRLSEQFAIAEEFGVLLDVHSADDLTSPVRKVIKKATGGKIHYKVSPMLQLLYADVLKDYHPDLFNRWYDDAVAYAEREAEAGSDFAAACLKNDEGKARDVHNEVFHHYSFAYVGKRDDEGRFLWRDEFYRLSPEFYAAHEKRISDFLSDIASDLF